MKKFIMFSIIILISQAYALAQIVNYVVLAEVYGGGGEQGSYWTNDYIILYNPTSNSVDLSTWSVQYAVFNGSTWQITNLLGTIPAGGYYSIQQGGDGQGNSPLPFTPNVIGNINLDKNKGKVALVSFQNPLTISNPIGSPGVIDFIGYGEGTSVYEGSGAAPQSSTTESVRRKDNSGNNTYGINGNGWDSNNNNLDFYLENNLVGNPPLPVELSYFSAGILENGVKLKWRTETEVSNYGFGVQKSEVGSQNTEWNTIGFVKGHGNSNSPKDYSFIDNTIAGGKYSYRLKQIDTDGQFKYSKVIEVDLGSPAKFELSQNYPNPFNPVTTIRFALSESGNTKLTVYNLVGEQVAILVDEFIEKGVHTVNFNAETLPSGLYIYKIEANGLTQSRKMILAK